MVAKYFQKGLGYALMAPGDDGYYFWFGSLKEVREFAEDMGWKLKYVP